MMLLDRPPPFVQTSAKKWMPWPAVSCSDSAVERVMVARNIASASGGSSPVQSANDRSAR